MIENALLTIKEASEVHSDIETLEKEGVWDAPEWAKELADHYGLCGCADPMISLIVWRAVAKAYGKVYVRRTSMSKETFIRQLAEFLVKDQAVKSIGLENGNPAFCEWACLRECTPLKGYPSVEDAIKTLTEFLS